MNCARKSSSILNPEQVDSNMAASGDPKNAQSDDFDYIDIDGKEQSMSRYKGHVLIVVNVASKWGKTPVNYTQLTALHTRYGGTEGLKILGFPCNQFGGQEPGTEQEIKKWAEEKYQVRWDLASKIDVNGSDTHPLWTYMKNKKGGFLGNFIKWNFTKFLIDKNGQVVGRFATTSDPMDMEKDLKKYFAQAE